MKKIIHVFNVQAQSQKVYDALTSQAGLSGWWTTDVVVQPEVGGKIDFRFGDVFNPKMQITALQEGNLVEWKCVAGEENWLENTFRFELRGNDGTTQVMFTQDYSRELSDEVYGNYNFNWGYYLGSLKALCETGKGFPFQA